MDDKWNKSMAGGGNKKRYQHCTDSSGTILYLRALQGHSGCSFIDPTLQDNVVIQSNFFQFIYHVGCAFNLHSIINLGLIPGGQILNNRETGFFLLVDPMDKNHKDPDAIDLKAPRHAQYMHKAWKRHQNPVFWVDIHLALSTGLQFNQTRSNAIILHETLPPYCIPKVVRMKCGEVIYEKVYMSPQKLLDNQKEKLCDNSKVPNQTNQFQIQIMIERGSPLLENQPKERVKWLKNQPRRRRGGRGAAGVASTAESLEGAARRA